MDTEPKDEQSASPAEADQVVVPSEASQAAEVSAESRAKLRALLDGVELAPSQTSDDIAPKVNRDSELLRDVPPHHG